MDCANGCFSSRIVPHPHNNRTATTSRAVLSENQRSFFSTLLSLAWPLICDLYGVRWGGPVVAVRLLQPFNSKSHFDTYMNFLSHNKVSIQLLSTNLLESPDGWKPSTDGASRIKNSNCLPHPPFYRSSQETRREKLKTINPQTLQTFSQQRLQYLPPSPPPPPSSFFLFSISLLSI